VNRPVNRSAANRSANSLDKGLAGKARRVLIAQVVMTALVAVAFYGFSAEQSAWKALSVGYGGLTSVVLALISIGGFKRANAVALSNPGQSMIILYIGAVVRFVAVIVLLGVGLGVLKLDAMAVFVGFALAQASYLMSVRDREAARSSD